MWESEFRVLEEAGRELGFGGEQQEDTNTNCTSPTTHHVQNSVIVGLQAHLFNTARKQLTFLSQSIQWTLWTPSLPMRPCHLPPLFTPLCTSDTLPNYPIGPKAWASTNPLVGVSIDQPIHPTWPGRPLCTRNVAELSCCCLLGLSKQ
jgi:hypothetical protein